MEWMRCLPENLQRQLEEAAAETLCDVRLFANLPCRVRTIKGERTLRFTPDARLLYEMAQRLSDHMLRLSPEKTGQGFISLRGGHRMGLCGRVTQKDGQLVLQEIGSVCLRIAHEVRGCGETAAVQFLQNRQGMLLCGIPGSGKTTMLRDILRVISEGGVPVGISDERGEIAACMQGVPQLDVGPRTHVLDGCPKAEALRWLLRAACPAVLGMDELYGMEECCAVREAAACGVPVIASMHAGSPVDLCHREGVRALLQENVFGRVIFIRDRRVEKMLTVEETLCCGR